MRNEWCQRARLLWQVAALACLGACNGETGGLTDPGVVAKESVDAGEFPAVAAIAMSGQVTRYGAVGTRRAGGPHRLQISMFDRFAIGSMTKSMTATLAGILVQQGMIQWDVTLYEVLPELALGGLADYRNVTLRDLVTHSSGLYPGTTEEQIAAIPPLTGSPRQQREQFAQWAVTIPPAIVPGDQTEYSNGGYVVAGAMLERVMNQAYEQLMEKHLFRPLGISPKFAVPAASDDINQPWPHLRDPVTNAWTAIDPRSEELYYPPFANPSGAVSLRLYEFAAYMKMHLLALQGNTRQIISPDTARLLHTEVLELQSLGWVVTLDDSSRPISFTAGSDEYSFYGMMAISADRDRAAIVLTNGYDADTEEKLARALTRLLD